MESQSGRVMTRKTILSQVQPTHQRQTHVRCFQVRPAEPGDEAHLVRWLVGQKKSYVKFSLSTLPKWLKEGYGLLAEDATGFVGFLLCIRTAGHFATVSGLAVDALWDAEEVVRALIQRAMPALRRQGLSTLTCVTAADWLKHALSAADFQSIGHLASYVKRGWDIPEPGNRSVVVRPCRRADLSDLLDVDRAAFVPLWRYDEALMLFSVEESEFFLCAVHDARAVAYVCGTRSQEFGHIHRLVVHPDFQGRDIAKRLLAESISHFRHRDVHIITLNTQTDNLISRQLYEHYGFELLNCDMEIFARH